MTRILYIALGANLPSAVGFSHQTLRAVLTSVRRAGAVIEASAPLYRTAPIGDVGGFFINSAIRVRVACSAENFFARLERIERLYGKQNGGGARTLDLDILLSEPCELRQGQGQGSTLILPHPRMTERRFVLLPLAEIQRRQGARRRRHTHGLTLSGGGAVFLLHLRKK